MPSTPRLVFAVPRLRASRLHTGCVTRGYTLASTPSPAAANAARQAGTHLLPGAGRDHFANRDHVPNQTAWARRSRFAI